jgi:methionyl-tRNA synthetase
VFVQNKHRGEVPEPGKPGPDEDSITAELRKAFEETGSLIEAGHYDRGLRRVLEFAATCNQYFQKKSPWENRDDEPTAIFYSCNLVAGLAVLLSPFLPFASDEAWRELGFSGSLRNERWSPEFRIQPGRKVVTPKPIFRKLEDADLDAAQKLMT